MGIFIDVPLDLATNVATMIASKSDVMSQKDVNMFWLIYHKKVLICSGQAKAL